MEHRYGRGGVLQERSDTDKNGRIQGLKYTYDAQARLIEMRESGAGRGRVTATVNYEVDGRFRRVQHCPPPVAGRAVLHLVPGGRQLYRVPGLREIQTEYDSSALPRFSRLVAQSAPPVAVLLNYSPRGLLLGEFLARLPAEAEFMAWAEAETMERLRRAPERAATYAYDKHGNCIAEAVELGGEVVYRVERLFDAHGSPTQEITTRRGGSKARSEINYEYDSRGNWLRSVRQTQSSAGASMQEWRREIAYFS
ncbi:MAG: hypothetical protein ACRD2H_00870 [Terriglobales bacterium]